MDLSSQTIGADIDPDYVTLTAGATSVDSGSASVSPLMLVGNSAFPLLIDEANRVFAAASRSGQGKVLAFGHDNYLTGIVKTGNAMKIVRISPALIVADLTIDETAALGPRDVIVTNGTADGPLTLKGAFEVAAPLAITQLQGTLAEGSIYVARMRQLDVTTPLDPSSDGKNVSMSSAAGLGMTIEEVQDYTLDFTGYVDDTYTLTVDLQ